MGRKIAFKHSQGFSLIEVLVAVTILSVGLLALASLQIALVRASTATKAQSQALALAKDRLETLRNYTTLAGYQNSIVDQPTPQATTIGGITYNLTWEITRYVFNQDVDGDGTLNESGDQRFQAVADDTANETGATPTSSAGFVANNEFKMIKVSSAWAEPTGETATVSLVDATGAISPADSSLVGKAPTIALARTIPVIINNPAADAMVIPIAISSGTNSAATNPKPQVVVGTSTVETQFDVLTYANISGGTATAQQRVETIMVGCTCDLGEAPASTVRGKRPTYWDGNRYVVPVATSYAPHASADTQSATLQSPRCDVCCRDHEDPVGTTGALFSPLRATKASGTVTAAHPHYLDKLANAPATSGTYKEACRLIRIDGQWRVATDMNNDYFALLATGDGTTAATAIPDSTSVVGGSIAVGSVARYQAFVLDYLGGRFVTATVSAGSEQVTYNTVGATGSAADPYVKAATTAYVLNNPTSISVDLSDNVGKWMHSRALYIDYLEQEAVNKITDAKADVACTVDAATLKTCILKLLPFTSINLTEIADWAPLSGPLSVTNLDYSQSLQFGYPVRGKATTAALTAADIDATTSARASNSSLLDLSFDSISPIDDTKIVDTQRFVVGGGASASTVGNGNFPVTLAYPGTNTVVFSYLSTGTASTVSCGFSTAYICNVQNGSASGGLDVDGGLRLDVGGYNHQQAATSQTSPILTNCVGVGNAAGFPNINSNDAYSYAGIAQPYTGSVCNNYQVSAVTTTSPNPGTITWALAPSPADGIATPYPGEVTRITFGGRIPSMALIWTASTAFGAGDIVVPPKWVTATSYAVNDIVSESGTNYRALIAHVAGTFSTDLSASRWVKLNGATYKSASAHTSGASFGADVTAARWTLVPTWSEPTAFALTSVVVPPAWVTGTSYVVGDIVLYAGSAYKAVTAHNANASFTVDVSASRWTAALATTWIATVAHSSPNNSKFGAQVTAGRWKPYNSIAVTLTLQNAAPQTASSCTYTCQQTQSGDNHCKSGKATYFTGVFPACP